MLSTVRDWNKVTVDTADRHRNILFRADLLGSDQKYATRKQMLIICKFRLTAEFCR